MSEKQEINFLNFAEKALDDVNLPLFVKIGRYSKQLQLIIYSLSLISLLAGFLFFYKPIHNISDSFIVAFLVSFVILFFIEFGSLVSFELSILEINRSKSTLGGYALLIFSLSIVAFNMYSHAEGNKELVKSLATKPEKLENHMEDTITILDNDYLKKLTLIKNDYSEANNSINQEYSKKIESLEADIKSSFDDNGNLLDWRKNNEAVKNKALLLQNWEAKKTELSKNYLFEVEQLKQFTDSVKSRIFIKQSNKINEVTTQATNTGEVAYLMSFILGFLILSARSIFVFAKIATDKWVKEHPDSEIIVTKKTYKIETDVIDKYLDRKKLINKSDKELPDKQEKKDNPVFEISNPEVLEEGKKQLLKNLNGNGNGNGSRLNELTL